MTLFNYYLFDAGARLVDSETAEHDDILGALERMRTLLEERAPIAMVQLWQAQDFVGHINRHDGRVILRSKADPVPVHPLLAQDRPETKTG